MINHLTTNYLGIIDVHKHCYYSATCYIIYCLLWSFNVLTSLNDINTGRISTQVVSGDTDVDSILVHLCDGESEIATCRVRVQVSVFLSHQYPGEADGRVPSGCCAHQINRLANHNWRYWTWLYSCPTGGIWDSDNTRQEQLKDLEKEKSQQSSWKLNPGPSYY